MTSVQSSRLAGWLTHRLGKASVAVVFLISVILTAPMAQSAKAPGSLKQLRAWASHVVVGTVVGIDIGVSPAHYDTAWGNTDWLITVRLAVQEVEKGDNIHAGEEISVITFQPRTRRAMLESLAPGGHSPIPAKGQQVRVYLQARDGCFRVYLPNGFTPPGEYLDDATRIRQPEITTAPEVRDLWHWWTFGMPIEAWLLAGLIGLPVSAGIGLWASLRAKSNKLPGIVGIGVSLWSLALFTVFIMTFDLFTQALPMLASGITTLIGYAAIAFWMFRQLAVTSPQPATPTTGSTGSGQATEPK